MFFPLRITLYVLLLCSVGSTAVETGNFAADYTKNGLSLRYKGVPVIRRSSLYVVSPGWTKLIFGQHLVKQQMTSEDVPGGKVAKVSMTNDVFAATYTVTMLDSDQATIDLAYRLLQDVPAEIEYCLGYFSAPLLADSPFEAETVEGRKSGIVPHAARSADQRESMLVPPFRRLKVDSRLAEIDLSITGDQPNLVIFDARRDPQPWAREAPIFWCGLGVPARPIKFGKECHITAKLTFNSKDHAITGPAIEPASVKITAVKNAKLPIEELAKIIPEPKSARFTESDFPITKDTLIVLPDNPTADDRFAAECLNEELRDIYGLDLPAIPAGEVRSESGIIVIGEPARNSVLAKLGKDIRPPSHGEGYALKACPRFVLVAGSDVRGTFYGVQTLIQLLKPTIVGAAVHGAVVSDWPTMKFRGAHVFVGNEAKPFLEKLISRVFARYKLNALVIEAEYTKWDSHPEIALPWSMSKPDLKEVIDFARRNHMEVIPLVQSLGHSEWMFKNDQNLNLAEDPNRPYGYCPSNPESYKFIFQVYDEALDLFKPKYFHIGHDEVTMGGRFPHDEQCKAKGITKLFLDDVGKLHDYFAKKGVKVMLWGDMMLHKSETPDAGWAESPEGARERRDKLPKDITIVDWHYCSADDFPSVRIFKGLGHKVIAATWYDPRNIHDFSQSAKKDGADGLLQTLWAGYNINESVLTPSFQQFHAYILAAEYAWNTGRTPIEDLPYAPAEEFTRLWKREKADHSTKDGFTIDLSPYANMPLKGSWLGYDPQHDLRRFKGRRLRGIAFEVSGAVLLAGPMNPKGEWPSSLKLPINRKAANLVFLMTTGWHEEKGSKVGSIIIRYSNGESTALDLVYGENITSWSDSSATPSAHVGWIGKTPAGEKAVLRMIDWCNPHPDREVQSVEIASDAGSPIILAITGLAH